MKHSIIDDGRENAKSFESKAKAQAKASELKEMVDDPESISVVQGSFTSYAEYKGRADGGTVDVVEHTDSADEPPQTAAQEPQEKGLGTALAEIGDSIETDPLDVLPGYMITHVDGKPSLNKRGVSVLAYHYGIDVQDRETIAYPHETDYQTAVVEITVTNEEGRTFVGSGEAHVDETPKHQLLRMAETRAYKRAVIFATGCGIVGYHEIVEEL